MATTSPWAGPGSVSIQNASDETRSAFLRRVGLWTAGGLSIAALSALVMCVALFSIPALWNRFIMMGIVFGGMFVVNSLEKKAYENSIGSFVLGMGVEGLTMGYVVSAAAVMGLSEFGNPFVILGQGLLLVGLTVVGMCAYLITGPKNFSMLGGLMSAISLPLMIAVGLSWVFPVGGVIGMVFNVVLIGLSAAGLLFNMNKVMHHARTDMHIGASYTLSIGILILYWNILTLLMRLQSRD